jgi:hypothetical protein
MIKKRSGWNGGPCFQATVCILHLVPVDQPNLQNEDVIFRSHDINAGVFALPSLDL